MSPKVEQLVTKVESAAPPKPRTMRLPKNSAYPNFSETHLEDDWCAKAGCTPVCEPRDESAYAQLCEMFTKKDVDYAIRAAKEKRPPNLKHVKGCIAVSIA